MPAIGFPHSTQTQARVQVPFVSYSWSLPPASATPALLWSYSSGPWVPARTLGMYQWVWAVVEWLLLEIWAVSNALLDLCQWWLLSPSQALLQTRSPLCPTVKYSPAHGCPISSSALWCGGSEARLFAWLGLWETWQPIEQTSLYPAWGQTSISVLLLSSGAQASFSLPVKPWGPPTSKVSLSLLRRTPGLGCPSYGFYHSLPRVSVCPCILPFPLGPFLGHGSQLDCFSCLPTQLIICVSFL